MKQSRASFTLIELLIVVAIIAILAAIAVPNFLEAQTRSKVSRVKADMRSVATGLEAYLVDYNRYPIPFNAGLWLGNAWELTTPVAYLTSVNFPDPFYPPDLPAPGVAPTIRFFSYFHNPWWIDDNDLYQKKAWLLASYGPSRKDTSIDGLGVEHYPSRYWAGHTTDLAKRLSYLYDPTNGTKSAGAIIRCGGDIPEATPN